MNLNRCFLAGRLTRDPDLRFSPKGTGVCEFTVAVNHKRKDAAGETLEEVSFIGCTAFGKTAETIAQYFKKGNPIFVEGRLRTESWEDKTTGQKREKTKVSVERFEFVGKPAQAEETQQEFKVTPKGPVAKEEPEDSDPDGVPF